MESLRNNQKEMLEIKKKNTVTEMKNASDCLIRLATAKENIFEQENISIQSSKTENQREKDWMEKNTQGL